MFGWFKKPEPELNLVYGDEVEILTGIWKGTTGTIKEEPFYKKGKWQVRVEFTKTEQEVRGICVYKHKIPVALKDLKLLDRAI